MLPNPKRDFWQTSLHTCCSCAKWYAKRLHTNAVRAKFAGSRTATCRSISAITSDGTLEIGQGGGGVFSTRGSAWGIGRPANEARSSGVGNTSAAGAAGAVTGTAPGLRGAG